MNVYQSLYMHAKCVSTGTHSAHCSASQVAPHSVNQQSRSSVATTQHHSKRCQHVAQGWPPEFETRTQKPPRQHHSGFFKFRTAHRRHHAWKEFIRRPFAEAAGAASARGQRINSVCSAALLQKPPRQHLHRAAILTLRSADQHQCN